MYSIETPTIRGSFPLSSQKRGAWLCDLRLDSSTTGGLDPSCRLCVGEVDRNAGLLGGVFGRGAPSGVECGRVVLMPGGGAPPGVEGLATAGEGRGIIPGVTGRGTETPGVTGR